MLRIENPNQVTAQRHLRSLYANTQATPYAGFLSSTLADGSTPFTRGSGAVPGSAGQGPIFPGICAGWANAGGENFAVFTAGATMAPAGLFANYVGGDFDDLGSQSWVSVWYGPGSVWEVLTPVFNSNITAADEATGADRLLYPDANGKLNDTQTGSDPAFARLIDWVSASKIVVMLLV